MISYGWILSDVPNHKWNTLVPLPPTSRAKSSCMTRTHTYAHTTLFLSRCFSISLAHALDGWLSSAFCLRCHTNEWVSWEYVILWKGHRRHVYHITVNDNKKNNLCKSIFEVIFIRSYCEWFYLSLLFSFLLWAGGYAGKNDHRIYLSLYLFHWSTGIGESAVLNRGIITFEATLCKKEVVHPKINIIYSPLCYFKPVWLLQIEL